jgi:hypothetical protein
MRRLTLDEYREVLGETPSPSAEQLDAFARFVSTAHSWYKHLPTLPPGVPMIFYLDPGAGTQRVVDKRGRVREVKRRTHGFHYSWLPTAEYRDRFGCAAFASMAGTTVSLIRSDGSQHVPSDNEPLIFAPRYAELVALPTEVLEAGMAEISGLIHNRAACFEFWRWLPAGYDDPSRFHWPAESGGADAYTQILERLQALRGGAPVEEVPSGESHREDYRYLSGLPSGDLVLHRLLIPERERQQRGIVAALCRVIELTG